VTEFSDQVLARLQPKAVEDLLTGGDIRGALRGPTPPVYPLVFARKQRIEPHESPEVRVWLPSPAEAGASDSQQKTPLAWWRCLAEQLIPPGDAAQRVQSMGPIGARITWGVADPVANVLTLLCFGYPLPQGRRNSAEGEGPDHSPLDHFTRWCSKCRSEWRDKLVLYPTIQLVFVADDIARTAFGDAPETASERSVWNEFAAFRSDFEGAQRTHGRANPAVDFRWQWLDLDEPMGVDVARAVLFAHLPRVTGDPNAAQAGAERGEKTRKILKDELETVRTRLREVRSPLAATNDLVPQPEAPPSPLEDHSPPTEWLAFVAGVRHWRVTDAGAAALPFARFTFIAADNAAGKSSLAEALHKLDRGYARDLIPPPQGAWQWRHSDAEKAPWPKPPHLGLLQASGPRAGAGRWDVLFGTDTNLSGLDLDAKVHLLSLSATGLARDELIAVSRLVSALEVRERALREARKTMPAQERQRTDAEKEDYARDLLAEFGQAIEAESQGKPPPQWDVPRNVYPVRAVVDRFVGQAEAKAGKAGDVGKALRARLDDQQALPAVPSAKLFWAESAAWVRLVYAAEVAAETSSSAAGEHSLDWLWALVKAVPNDAAWAPVLVELELRAIESVTQRLTNVLAQAVESATQKNFAGLETMLRAYFEQGVDSEARANTARLVALGHAGRLARVMAHTRERWRPLLVDDPALGHDVAIAARGICRFGNAALKAASERWMEETEAGARIHPAAPIWFRQQTFGEATGNGEPTRVATWEQWTDVPSGLAPVSSEPGDAPRFPSSVAQLAITSYQVEAAEIAANQLGVVLSPSIKSGLQRLLPPAWRGPVVAHARAVLSRLHGSPTVHAPSNALNRGADMSDAPRRLPASTLRLAWGACVLPRLDCAWGGAKGAPLDGAVLDCRRAQRMERCETCQWREKATSALQELGLRITALEFENQSESDLDAAARCLLTWLVANDWLPALLEDGARSFFPGTLTVLYLSNRGGWNDPIGATRLMRLPPLLQLLPSPEVAARVLPHPTPVGKASPVASETTVTPAVLSRTPPDNAEEPGTLDAEDGGARQPDEALREPLPVLHAHATEVVEDSAEAAPPESEPSEAEQTSEAERTLDPEQAAPADDASPHDTTPHDTTPHHTSPEETTSPAPRPQDSERTPEFGANRALHVIRSAAASTHATLPPLKLAVWTRPGMQLPPEYEAFPKASPHSSVPENPDFWRNDILQPIAERLREHVQDGGRDVALFLRAHLSVAVALGALMPHRRGMRVTCEQGGSEWALNREGPRRWRTPDSLVAKRRSISEANELHARVGITQSLAATHELGYVERTKGKLVPGDIAFRGKVVELEPPGGPSNTSVPDGRSALDMADCALRLIARAAHNPQRLHLFIAAPVAVAVAIGRGVSEVGRVQLWEFDRDGTKRYFESLRIP
jgi:hypothetical protein